MLRDMRGVKAVTCPSQFECRNPGPQEAVGLGKSTFCPLNKLPLSMSQHVFG